MAQPSWAACLGLGGAVLLAGLLAWPADAADPPDAELPESYVHFGQMTERLVAPLVPLMRDGMSHLPLEGPPSDHDAAADRLEAFARPGLLLALWLQMEPLPEDLREHDFTRDRVAAWWRRALVIGTDPDHEAYFGDLTNYYQHGVEMAILTMSLQVARERLWEPLSRAEKDQVADWLGQIRGNARYWNNHLYFAVLVLEWLRANGYEEPADAAAIQFMFELLEGMHQGGGWFKDGTNESFDHYNAFAFHTYGLWWVWQYGHTAPARAQRWTLWSHAFIRDYARLFAASGEHLPYGRSITYRFNSLSVFGLAAQNELGVLPLGMMRRICRKNLEFFLSQPIQQSQGALAIGWVDEFIGMREPYSAPGSPYWAAKGLMMLTLPPDHAFWHEPEQPYPAESGDFTLTVKAPRFVIRGLDGQVELLNAGSQVSRSGASRYGAWKWSKIAYRTGLGFLVAPDFDLYPYDATLTATPRRLDQRFGRHPTLPIEADADHLSYIYALGTRDDGFNAPVRTDVYWRGEWILAIHRVEPFEPTRFFHGSFALGSDEPSFDTAADSFPHAMVVRGGDPADRMASAIQSISGFESAFYDGRLDEDTPRRHLSHRFDMTPVLQTGWLHRGEHVLAVLFWAGRDPEHGAPWEILETRAGHWAMRHPALGTWRIDDPALPAIDR